MPAAPDCQKTYLDYCGRVRETKRFPTGIRRADFARSRKRASFKAFCDFSESRWSKSLYTDSSSKKAWRRSLSLFWHPEAAGNTRCSNLSKKLFLYHETVWKINRFQNKSCTTGFICRSLLGKSSVSRCLRFHMKKTSFNAFFFDMLKQQTFCCSFESLYWSKSTIVFMLIFIL